MAGVPVAQIRKGQVIRIDDRAYKVLDHHLNTPGNLRAQVTFKLRDMESGATFSKRFNSNTNVETVYFGRRSCQYLFQEGNSYVFMDNETYDQFNLDAEVLGDNMKYVPLNTNVQVMYLEERPVDIELPASVTLNVVEAEPSIRGDTATNVTKRVVCETGLEVKAPQHINAGERISVDTRTGEFLGRAKD